MIVVPSRHVQKSFEQIKFTDVVNGKTVNFELLKFVKDIPDTSKITSVAVIPTFSNGRIIVTKLERGFDIPGGHVEINDKNIENTARREALEEACIEIGAELTVVGVIASDYMGRDPENTTYMVIFTALVTTMKPFSANYEAVGRKEMGIDEFIKHYRAGSVAMMQELIDRVKAMGDD